MKTTARSPQHSLDPGDDSSTKQTPSQLLPRRNYLIPATRVIYTTAEEHNELHTVPELTTQHLAWKPWINPGNNSPQKHYNSLQEAGAWPHITTLSGANRHWLAPPRPDPLKLQQEFDAAWDYPTICSTLTALTYTGSCVLVIIFACLFLEEGGGFPASHRLYPDIWLLWKQFWIEPQTMILVVMLALLSPWTRRQIRFKRRHEFSRVWREQLVQRDSWRWKACSVSQFLIVSAVRKQPKYSCSYFLHIKS